MCTLCSRTNVRNRPARWQKNYRYVSVAIKSHSWTEGALRLMNNHAPVLVHCSLFADCCELGVRRFMGRRFTLRFVRPKKRVLHCPTRFAVILPTRALSSACDRYCRPAAARVRGGRACVSIQSKWRTNRASRLHRARVAERFLHQANRFVNTRPRERPRCGSALWPLPHSSRSPGWFYVVLRSADL